MIQANQHYVNGIEFERDKFNIFMAGFASSLSCGFLSFFLFNPFTHTESPLRSDEAVAASVVVPMLPLICAILLLKFMPEQTVAFYRRCTFSRAAIELDHLLPPRGAQPHPPQQNNHPRIT